MPARTPLCISLFCAACSLMAVPAIAQAEPPPTPASNPSEADLARARELFDNGKSLYLDGSYDPAVAAFKQAYALSGDPLLLYNIAHAYDRAERHDEAIEYFEYYRAFAPADERDALAQKVEGLRRRKLRAQSEQPEPIAEPPPGEEPEATQAEPKKAGPRPAPSTSDEPEDFEAPKQRVFNGTAIALTSVAVVGLGAGAGLAVASRQRSDDAQALCSTDPVVCSSPAEGHINASRRLALGADISFGIGAAAAVATIIVVAVNASKRKRGSQAKRRSRVQIAGHRRGAALRVRF